eukprot:469075-Amorphochlora_amoeboformis.AAC.1
MKAPRDMQVMKEIIRIYGTKSTLKFLISERSWDAAEVSGQTHTHTHTERETESESERERETESERERARRE